MVAFHGCSYTGQEGSHDGMDLRNDRVEAGNHQSDHAPLVESDIHDGHRRSNHDEGGFCHDSHHLLHGEDCNRGMAHDVRSHRDAVFCQAIESDVDHGECQVESKKGLVAMKRSRWLNIHPPRKLREHP
jgi:hypothetical protein